MSVDVGRSGLTMLLNTDSKHSCSSLENSHLPDTLVTIFAGDTAVTLAELLLKDGAGNHRRRRLPAIENEGYGNLTEYKYVWSGGR